MVELALLKNTYRLLEHTRYTGFKRTDAAVIHFQKNLKRWVGNTNPFRFNLLVENIRGIRETFQADSAKIREAVFNVTQSERVRTLCEASETAQTVTEVHIDFEQNTKLVFLCQEDCAQRKKRVIIRNAVAAVLSTAVGFGAISFFGGDLKQNIYGAVVGLISFLTVKAWHNANPMVKRYSIKSLSARLDESEKWVKRILDGMEISVKAEQGKQPN